MLKKADVIALLILAGYILSVGIRGNFFKLVDELGKESGFIKWIAAWGVFLVVLSIFPNKIQDRMIMLTVVLLFFANPNLINRLNKLFQEF